MARSKNELRAQELNFPLHVLNRVTKFGTFAIQAETPEKAEATADKIENIAKSLDLAIDVHVSLNNTVVVNLGE